VRFGHAVRVDGSQDQGGECEHEKKGQDDDTEFV
jgi:hypothetical protein